MVDQHRVRMADAFHGCLTEREEAGGGTAMSTIGKTEFRLPLLARFAAVSN